MLPTEPNAHSVQEAGHREIVATCGSRAYAAINIALCKDGLYRYGLDMHYAHGGFGVPIFTQNPGYPALDTARTAALEHLRRAWHEPFPSDPDSVRKELLDMRRQIEERLAQPTLF